MNNTSIDAKASEIKAYLQRVSKWCNTHRNSADPAEAEFVDRLSGAIYATFKSIRIGRADAWVDKLSNVSDLAALSVPGGLITLVYGNDVSDTSQTIPIEIEETCRNIPDGELDWARAEFPRFAKQISREQFRRKSRPASTTAAPAPPRFGVYRDQPAKRSFDRPAKAEFKARVEKLVGEGMSHARAVVRVIADNPNLQQRMIDEANQLTAA